MNDYNLPSIGDKIEIDNRMLMKNNTKLISQVLDVIDDKHMFIAMPIVNNVVVPIPTGEIIQIKYAKKSVGVFAFSARVLSRKHSEHLSYMKIERLSDVKKVQRRDFFRLDIVLDVTMKLVGTNGIGEGNSINALTKDISGGGLRIISKTKLIANDLIDIDLKTDEGIIHARGRVIRCVPYESSSSDYDIAVIFDSIQEQDRTQIISFIFNYQRKMKKKGLV
jgi:c-di-GMP-binding flagellar brake protein YcgR